MIEQRLDVFPRLARDEGNGDMPHRGKSVAQIVNPPLGWHLAVEQVPLVDDEDARFVLLRNIFAKLLIDLAQSLRAIEKHQHHVGPANATLRPMKAVKVDVAANASMTPHSCRINRDKRLS